jgi:hypothetical protein
MPSKNYLAAGSENGSKLVAPNREPMARLDARVRIREICSANNPPASDRQEEAKREETILSNVRASPRLT